MTSADITSSEADLSTLAEPLLDAPGPSGLKLRDIFWIVGLSLFLPFAVGLTYGFYLISQGYSSEQLAAYLELPEVNEYAAVLGMVIMSFGPVLLVGIFAWRRGLGLSDIGLCRSPRRYFFYAFLGLLLVSAIGTAVVPYLAASELERLSKANDDLMVEGGRLYILIVFFAIVLVPFAEELFFRVAVYGALLQHMPSFLAVLLGTGLFAAAHTQYLLLGGQAAAFGLFQIFLLGVVLSWLFIKSGSIWPSVLLHSVNNALAFLLPIYFD
jgi:CAAX protease family protein